MEEQIDQEEPSEKTTHKCISCGKVDTGEYCSYCGSKLVFLGDVQASSFQNLINIFKEYFREVVDPIFAYLKTIYLLLVRPVTFFRTLHLQDQSIDAIPFPLKRLWERVSGSNRTQYTLH